MRDIALKEAKLLTHQMGSGVLSTISHNLRGYPFGSVSPYMLSDEGKAYFFISDIAQHTKNLQHDSRMSLTIYQQAEGSDQNEHGRVTIVGDATLIAKEQSDKLLEQYLRLFPEAQSYRDAHDFNLWQLDAVRVRYIGGFGKIFWLEAQEWKGAPSPWDFDQEKSMIDHMNDDHQDAMSLILHHHHHINDPQPVMSGIGRDGCYIQSQGSNYYVPFAHACENNLDARKSLVALTQQARSAA